MRLASFVLALSLCLLMIDSAEAGRRWPGAWRRDPYQQHLATPVWGGPRTAAYWREAYPQYYGGFHARHLQNIGIPTGDIGIRGNSITVNPW